jgi:diaminopropionate ammonia-lyase
MDAYLTDRGRDWRTAGVVGDPPAFHRTLPEYAPTPLRDLPQVAGALGLGRVVVKTRPTGSACPRSRCWALRTRAQDRRGGPCASALVTATDGNHGRAVARSGRLLGSCRVRGLRADGVHPAAVAAIEGEGATVVATRAEYDEAVRGAGADAAASGAVLLQDTAWPGYERIPGWIADGLHHDVREIERPSSPRPGIGRTRCWCPSASGRWRWRRSPTTAPPTGPTGPRWPRSNPTRPACVLASLHAGELTRRSAPGGP